VRYECEIVSRIGDGESVVEDVGPIEASSLPEAIKLIEAKVPAAPNVFRHAVAVRLRHRGKVVWLRALGASLADLI
jgi:hypothetical protein